MQGAEANENRLIEEVVALRARVATLERVNRRLARQQNAEESLDEAWMEWERTFDAARDSIMVLDSDFRIIQANLATSRFLGKPFEQIIGQTCWKVVHDTDGPCAECPLKVAQKTKNREEAQLYVSESGVWVEVSVDPILDNQGRIVKAIHIIRDTTERRLATDALAATEDRFRSICDNANDVIVFVTKLGKILEVNKRVKDILGYDRDELIGKNFLTSGVLAAKNAATIVRLFKESVNGGGFPGNRDGRDVTEVWLNHKNGRTVLVEASTTATRNNGNLEGFVSILRDITERKQADEALRQSEERYRTLVDTAQEGIWIIDANAKTSYVNQRMAEMLGYTAEQMLNRSLYDFMEETVRTEAERCFERRKNGISEQHDFRFRRRDGSALWTTVTTNPIFDEDGRFAGALGMIADVTESKQAREREKEYIRELEFLSESATRFAQFPLGADLYGYIASRLKELVPSAIVAISSYERQTGSLRLRELLGLGSNTKAVIKLMGANPIGKCFEIDDQAREGLSRGELEKVPGGIYDLSPGIPRAVCQAIEKLLGLGDVYGMGLSWKEELLGSIIVLTRSRDELSNRSFIEAFIRQAAVALQRAEAERALQEGEERIDAAIDAASLGTWDWDLTTGHIVWAGHHDRIFGFAPGEFDGRYETFESRVHPDDVDGLKQAVERSSRERVDYAHEYRVVWPDGTTHWVAGRGRYRWDQKGRPTRMLGTVSDITDRKRAEEAYRALVDHSLQGLVIFQDGRVAFANKAMAEICGYTVQEMLEASPETVQAFVHPDDRELVWRRHQERLNGEVLPERYEIRGLRKDGSVCWLEIQASAIEYQGRPAIQAAYVDVTDRRKAEQLLRANQNRYAEAAHRARFGHWERDLVRASAVWSNEICDIFGVDAKTFEPTYENFLGLVHPSDRELLKSSVQKTLAGGRMQDIEYRIVRPDGQERWIQSISEVIHEKGEKGAKLAGTIHDITERKRAEEALLKSEEQLKAIFEGVADGIVYADRKGNVLEVNPAFTKITGIPREQVVGDNAVKLARCLGKPKDLPQLLKAISDGLMGKPVRIPELEINNKVMEIVAPALKKETAGITAVIRDVTGQKTAEKALRESEQRLRILFECAPDGIYLNDLEGNFVDGNRAAEELTGYRKQELIGKNFAEAGLLWPSDIPRAVANLGRLAAGEPIGPDEYTLRRKDGTQIVVEIRAFPVRINGQTLSLGIARDITKRKQTEEALHVSEERLRILAETIDDVLWMSTPGIQEMVYISPSYEKIWGRSCQSLYENPMSFMEVIHPEDRDQFLNTVKEYHASGKPYKCEYRILPSDGELRWISERAFPVFDDNGDLRYMTGVCTDITERKKAEIALRAAEELFSKAFHASPDAMTISQMADGMIIKVNNMWEKVFGYSQTEAIGKSSVELGVWFDPAMRQKAVQLLRETGSLRNFEVDIRCKTGEVRQVILSSERLEIRGEENFITIIHDVTERKRAEQALRESEARLSEAMKIAKLGYWEYDVADDVFIFNDQFYSVCRTSAAQVGGYRVSPSRYAELFLLPDDGPQFGEEIQRAAENSDPDFSRDAEHRFVYGDGKIGYVSVRYFVAKDSQGRTVKTYGVSQDITDRKNAEQTQREQKEVLQIILDNIPVMVAFLDSDATHKWVNRAWERNLGWSLTDAQSRDILKELYPDPEYCRYVVDFIHKAESKWGDFKVHRRNGTTLETMWTNVPLTDGSNIGIGLDITERKKAEHLLRKERDKAQKYLNVAAVMMVAVDSEQRVGLINNKGCEILGYAEEEILGRNWFDNFLPERVRNEVKAVFGKFVRGQADAPEYYENPILAKDGREPLIAWHNTTLRDEQGNFVAILSSGEDITQRRKVEDVLKQQRLLSQVFLDSMPCVALLLRPQTREIVAANRQAEEIGVVPGTTCYGAWAGRETACPWCLAPEVWNTGQSRHLEIEYGGIVWDAHWVPIEENLYLHFAFDITERKKVEVRLLEYQAKLKTMASEILKAEDRERHRIAVELHDEICQKLVLAKVTLESSLRLIADASLSSSLRIVSGALGETIARVDSATFSLSNPVLHKLGLVIALKRHLADEIRQKYGITFELEGDEKLSIPSDELRNCLFRISRELLANVVKHAQARNVKVSVHDSPDQIRVRIQDDGIGFKESQADDETFFKNRFGLFSVREQLEYVGGTLAIESEPGRGTTVTVVVPTGEKNE